MGYRGEPQTPKLECGSDGLADPVEEQIGRRNASRFAVDDGGELLINGVTFRVIISDLSRSGARCRHPAPPPVGAEGLLRWQNLQCHCVLAWSAGAAFGIRFLDEADELEVAAKAAAKRVSSQPWAPAVSITPPIETLWEVGRRTQPRVRLGYPCQVRQANRWINATLTSISKQGIEICWISEAVAGQRLHVRGEGLPAFVAEVIWSNFERLGCKLEIPLHDAVLDHVLAKLRGNL